LGNGVGFAKAVTRTGAKINYFCEIKLKALERRNFGPKFRGRKFRQLFKNGRQIFCAKSAGKTGNFQSPASPILYNEYFLALGSVGIGSFFLSQIRTFRDMKVFQNK
jgi:hypothetical protein